jgi:hypothetical protein
LPLTACLIPGVQNNPFGDPFYDVNTTYVPPELPDTTVDAVVPAVPEPAIGLSAPPAVAAAAPGAAPAAYPAIAPIPFAGEVLAWLCPVVKSQTPAAASSIMHFAAQHHGDTAAAQYPLLLVPMSLRGTPSLAIRPGIHCCVCLVAVLRACHVLPAVPPQGSQPVLKPLAQPLCRDPSIT